MLKVTRELLEGLFEEYNRKYFGGVLGPCRMRIRNLAGFVGSYVYDGKPGRRRPASVIYLAGNVLVRWTPETLEASLVHEMVHMYVTTILGKERDGLLGHGRLFRRECRRIRRETGLIIHVHCFYMEDLIKDGLRTCLLDRAFMWLIDR